MILDATVKKSLDTVFKNATKALENISQGANKETNLQPSIVQFKSAQGVLTMLNLKSASLLIEEVKFLFNALHDSAIDFSDEIKNALSKALSQLSYYLEYLQTGNDDVPIVLLDTINTLREIRHQAPIMPDNIFEPDLSVGLPHELNKKLTNTFSEQDKQMFTKLHGLFQNTLAHWNKDPKKDYLIQLYKILDKAYEISHYQETAQLFWLATAFIEANLQPENIDSFKRILLQFDIKLKQMHELPIDVVVADKNSLELTKTLLFQIAISKAGGKRTHLAKKHYKLSHFMPDAATLAQIKASLEGTSGSKMREITTAVLKDLEEIREALDDYTLETEFDQTGFTKVVSKLNKIIRELQPLPLVKQTALLKKQSELLTQALAKKQQPSQEAFLRAAQALVPTVEAIKELRDKGTVTTDPIKATLKAVVKEARNDLDYIKDNFIVFSANPTDNKPLTQLPSRLNHLKGAMFIKPLSDIKPVIEKLSSYINENLLDTNTRPHPQVLQILANLITSIEFFFENIETEQVDLRKIIQQTVAYLQELEKAKDLVVEEEVIVSDIEEASFSESVPTTTSSVSSYAQPETANDFEEIPYLEGEADPELLDIFIEESEEEQARINEHLEIWRNNPNDFETLTVIRRSFHTLKGSGRMIGAKLIGEFAWSFENMLNRVLDKTIAADNKIVEILENGLAILHELIEQLKGGSKPKSNIMAAMANVDKISKGE